MIFLLISILAITLYLALKKPTYTVIFYIVASTKFLGFFDMGLFVIGGVDLGFFSINIIILLSAFFSKQWYKIDKFILPMVLTIVVLILYGVVNPYIKGYESFQQALIASKSFLYFSIFFYMFGRRKEIDIYIIIKYLKLLGIYLAIILIISLFVYFAPPFYLESYIGYKDYVRIYFPTYISLALFLFYVKWQKKMISSKKMIFIFLILFSGLIIAGHFSLTVSTLFSLGFIYFIWHKKVSINWYLFIKKTIYLFILIGIILSSSQKLRIFTVDSIELIVSGADVALSSRDRYNKFRWDTIEKNPYLGYGFIHKNAQIMKNFETLDTNKFMEKLGVIDSGYVDLLIRFGYIGMFFYLVVFGSYITTVLTQKKPLVYSLSMAAFLFQYYFMNYTWSVFSFTHGIIPMSLAFFILFNSERRLLE